MVRLMELITKSVSHHASSAIAAQPHLMLQHIVHQVLTDGDVLHERTQLALCSTSVFQLCAHAVALDLRSCERNTSRNVTGSITHMQTS